MTRKLYRLDIDAYREWYMKHANGLFLFDGQPVYIDDPYTSIYAGEPCVSVKEIDETTGCTAVPRRFLTEIEVR